MRTSLDVIEQAFRRLGIRAEDEALTADQRAYAETTLDALQSEISQEAPIDWLPDSIPPEAFIPLSNLLAAEIGPSYSVPSEPRGRAIMRLFAVIRPDDRDADLINAAPEYF
jgi:hypothetical protein